MEEGYTMAEDSNPTVDFDTDTDTDTTYNGTAAGLGDRL
jgi:hypothetical protein